MLFVDRTLPIQKYRTSSGLRVYGFAVGSEAREGKKKLGRRIVVGTPNGFGTELQAGFHPDSVIWCNGKRYYLENAKKPRLQLLLISRPPKPERSGPLQHGIGTVRIPRKQHSSFLVHTRGAEFEQGIMSCWYEIITWAYPGDLFLLNWSTHDLSTSHSRLLYVGPDFQVITLSKDNLLADCETHGIIPSSLPVSVTYDPEHYLTHLDRSEWKKL